MFVVNYRKKHGIKLKFKIKNLNLIKLKKN